MRTIGVSCVTNDWIASVRLTFGVRSTWVIWMLMILLMTSPSSKYDEQTIAEPALHVRCSGARCGHGECNAERRAQSRRVHWRAVGAVAASALRSGGRDRGERIGGRSARF